MPFYIGISINNELTGLLAAGGERHFHLCRSNCFQPNSCFEILVYSGRRVTSIHQHFNRKNDLQIFQEGHVLESHGSKFCNVRVTEVPGKEQKNKIKNLLNIK